MNFEYIDNYISMALMEDLGQAGDITTNATIGENLVSCADVIYKADGVLAGVSHALRVFDILAKTLGCPPVKVIKKTADGTDVKKGTTVIKISGCTRLILTGERTFLNILQRMSGIATYAKKLSDMTAGTGAMVVDTRKTTPNFRIFEKDAVRMGGAANHRFGLFDGILIKDNHIAASKSITAAVKKARAYAHHLIRIEVEAKNIEEVKEALMSGADVIMLDNMTPSEMKKAVKLIDGGAITEASGGINETNILEVARTGVDLISIGALTHSARSADISLDIIKTAEKNG